LSALEVKNIELAIVDNIRKLPIDKQLEVLNFVEFLKSKQDLDRAKNLPIENEPLDLVENIVETDNLSIETSKKPKERTIAQAILAVMNEANRPMTSQEICSLILEKQLYHFKTDDSHGMVYNTLWRHNVKTGKRSSPNKLFIQDDKYWVLPKSLNYSDELTKIEQDDREMVMKELEESIYEYFLISEACEEIDS